MPARPPAHGWGQGKGATAPPLLSSSARERETPSKASRVAPSSLAPARKSRLLLPPPPAKRAWRLALNQPGNKRAPLGRAGPGLALTVRLLHRAAVKLPVLFQGGHVCLPHQVRGSPVKAGGALFLLGQHHPPGGRARRAELKGEAPAVTGTERAGKCRGAGASARLRLREEQERQAKPSPAQACGLRAESAAWACLRRRVGAAASVTPRCRFFSRPLSHDTTHTHTFTFHNYLGSTPGLLRVYGDPPPTT